jgi:hypothetical protein
MIERMHRVLKNMLTKFCDGEPSLWEAYLKSALLALRSRTHIVSKFSPFYLLYGENVRLPGDLESPTVYDFKNSDDVDKFTNQELTKLGQDKAAANRRNIAQMELMKRNPGEENVGNELFEIGTHVKRVNHRKSSFKYKYIGP